MFFFIGLTMATIQGAYARRISPGGELAAVKRVWGLPRKWGAGWGRPSAGPWQPQGRGLRLTVPTHRPSCCWFLPSSSSAGGTRSPRWAWGCCSTPLVSERYQGQGCSGGLAAGDPSRSQACWPLLWADGCLTDVPRQLLQSWCPACPPWSRATVRGPSLDRGQGPRVGGRLAPDVLSPQARRSRRARSWARSGAWVPWPGRWDPWWLPQVRAVDSMWGTLERCSPPPGLQPSAPQLRPGWAWGGGSRPDPLSLRSVLAGRGPGLLHRVRRALPAPLPPPARPAATRTHAQGRVAGTARPQAGGAEAGSGRLGPGPLPCPWGPLG